MKISKKNADYVLPPVGNHAARLISIVDFGSQYDKTYDKTSRKIELTWELVDETHTWDEKIGPQPFVVSRRVTATLGKKSTLVSLVESWIGRKLDDEKDFKSGEFDMEHLLGTAGMCQISHVESGDRTYANIQALSTAPKSVKVAEPDNEVFIFDLDDIDYDRFDSFPQWKRELIEEAPEFTANPSKKRGSKKLA